MHATEPFATKDGSYAIGFAVELFRAVNDVIMGAYVPREVFAAQGKTKPAELWKAEYEVALAGLDGLVRFLALCLRCSKCPLPVFSLVPIACLEVDAQTAGDANSVIEVIMAERKACAAASKSAGLASGDEGSLLIAIALTNDFAMCVQQAIALDARLTRFMFGPPHSTALAPHCASVKQGFYELFRSAVVGLCETVCADLEPVFDSLLDDSWQLGVGHHAQVIVDTLADYLDDVSGLLVRSVYEKLLRECLKRIVDAYWAVMVRPDTLDALAGRPWIEFGAVRVREDLRVYDAFFSARIDAQHVAPRLQLLCDLVAFIEASDETLAACFLTLAETDLGLTPEATSCLVAMRMGQNPERAARESALCLALLADASLASPRSAERGEMLFAAPVLKLASPPTPTKSASRRVSASELPLPAPAGAAGAAGTAGSDSRRKLSDSTGSARPTAEAARVAAGAVSTSASGMLELPSPAPRELTAIMARRRKFRADSMVMCSDAARDLAHLVANTQAGLMHAHLGLGSSDADPDADGDADEQQGQAEDDADAEALAALLHANARDAEWSSSSDECTSSDTDVQVIAQERAAESGERQ